MDFIVICSWLDLQVKMSCMHCILNISTHSAQKCLCCSYVYPYNSSYNGAVATFFFRHRLPIYFMSIRAWWIKNLVLPLGWMNFWTTFHQWLMANLPTLRYWEIKLTLLLNERYGIHMYTWFCWHSLDNCLAYYCKLCTCMYYVCCYVCAYTDTWYWTVPTVVHSFKYVRVVCVCVL